MGDWTQKCNKLNANIDISKDMSNPLNYSTISDFWHANVHVGELNSAKVKKSERWLWIRILLCLTWVEIGISGLIWNFGFENNMRMVLCDAYYGWQKALRTPHTYKPTWAHTTHILGHMHNSSFNNSAINKSLNKITQILRLIYNSNAKVINCVE